MSGPISDAPESAAPSASATESQETTEKLTWDQRLACDDIEKQVWEQLRNCYDPEIPLNIVDLGLIYSCQVTPVPEGGHRVDVTMTLTAPGCGMGEYLKMEVEAKISTVPGIKAASVEVVFDPPWSDALLSEAGKLKLGLL